MGFIARRPGGRLTGLIDRLWRVDGDAGVPAGEPDTICPDGRTEIVLHLGDPMVQYEAGVWGRQPRHVLVAQMSGPVTIAPTGRVSMVGARFVTGALHRLLPMPQDRIAGHVLDLEAVWGAWTRDAVEQVAEIPSPEASLERFEQVLQSLVPQWAPAESFHAVDAAVRRLRATGGVCSIDQLARGAGVSRRQFERRFRNYVGLPPRLFGRIVRFQRAFRLVGAENGAAIAARCGYADQAHLVREFRRFAGHTPSMLAEADGLTAFFRG